jgi:alkyl sulfatase BDS1-like metallo-beta-lactamase superfamily hydrolase
MFESVLNPLAWWGLFAVSVPVIIHLINRMRYRRVRFAVELLNHVVFAQPDHSAAKALLASAYTTLGRGAENGPWRNFYLMGAHELRDGVEPPPLSLVNRDIVAALTVEQVFDSIAIRINGPKAWDLALAVDWHFTDLDEHWRTTLSNGVFVPERDAPAADVALTVTLTKPQLLQLLAGSDLDNPTDDSDATVLQSLVSVVDAADSSFAIVTP